MRSRWLVVALSVLAASGAVLLAWPRSSDDSLSSALVPLPSVVGDQGTLVAVKIDQRSPLAFRLTYDHPAYTVTVAPASTPRPHAPVDPAELVAGVATGTYRTTISGSAPADLARSVLAALVLVRPATARILLDGWPRITDERQYERRTVAVHDGLPVGRAIVGPLEHLYFEVWAGTGRGWRSYLQLHEMSGPQPGVEPDGTKGLILGPAPPSITSVRIVAMNADGHVTKVLRSAPTHRDPATAIAVVFGLPFDPAEAPDQALVAVRADGTTDEPRRFEDHGEVDWD